MTLEAMIFAEELHYEILDHALTDEYAAAIDAMGRGEPEGRERVVRAYGQLLQHSRDRVLRAA